VLAVLCAIAGTVSMVLGAVAATIEYAAVFVLTFILFLPVTALFLADAVLLLLGSRRAGVCSIFALCIASGFGAIWLFREL
jgi:hypothetical protein